MIQIDIDMPTDCASCWIRQNMGCKIANKSGWLNNRRDDKCPLKEQENKKLIDADKLREKLGFAECCEDCKYDSWKCGRDTIYSHYDFCAAIDIAIEELMQEGR